MTGEPARRVDQNAVRVRLRRRAQRKSGRAARIATLRVLGYSHERARVRMELSVDAYHRAKRWLTTAAYESEASPALLTLDEALRQYAERHVDGVMRLGMLRTRGMGRSDVQQHLKISDMEYETGWSWWRDALYDRPTEE